MGRSKGRSKRVESGRGWELLRPCEKCGRLPASCTCPADGAPGPFAPSVRIEKRKGRTVTVVSGLGLDAAGLRRTAAAWKRSLGAGGTLREGAIEIQGDRREEVRALLRKTFPREGE
jgi:translation initiation factor 1